MILVCDIRLVIGAYLILWFWCSNSISINNLRIVTSGNEAGILELSPNGGLDWTSRRIRRRPGGMVSVCRKSRSLFRGYNDVTGAEKKRAVFLSLIGPKCYKLLASLAAPAKPGEKMHTELVKALTKHYDSQPSEILQRFHFHTRFRKQDESVANYVSVLRSLAQKCKFAKSACICCT